MITVYCDTCKEPLGAQGALAFTPPSAAGLTRKYHVCTDCWDDIVCPAIENGEQA